MEELYRHASDFVNLWQYKCISYHTRKSNS